jgi:HK97 family phage prohead protease
MEHKQLDLAKCEVKMGPGAEGALQFSGYASMFDGLDSYGDTVKAGAYKNTLMDRDRPVQLRFNHYGPVIGKFTEMYEDERGLFVAGELTKGHSVAEDTAALLRHGAISGMSIGYIVKEEEQQGVIRALKEIELIEISIVESPADNSAHITSLKSATKLKDVEHILRHKGFSQKEATEIVATVKKIHGEREDEKAKEDNLLILKNFMETLNV